MRANLKKNVIAICTAMLFLLLSCFTYAESEMGNDAIKSPDGLYRVGKYTVTQIKVTEPPINGQYKFNSYIIERASTYSPYYKDTEFSKHYKVGDHYVNGLWAPDSQQFYSSIFVKAVQIPNGIFGKTIIAPQCDYWPDPTWGFSYIPTTVNLNGRKVSTWKQTNSFSNNHHVPKKSCDITQTNTRTCERECIAWKENRPSLYLFENKEDALEALSLGFGNPNRIEPTQHNTKISKPNKTVEPSEHQIKRSQITSEHLKKKAEEKAARQKHAENLAKARAIEKTKQEAIREEQRIENERKSEARKAVQKKKSEYASAIKILVKKRSEKLSDLDREFREKLGLPPRRNIKFTSREDRKAEALAYAEARKNKKPITMSREEQRATKLAYAEARKKVGAEYQKEKAKLLKEKQ